MQERIRGDLGTQEDQKEMPSMPDADQPRPGTVISRWLLARGEHNA